MTALEAVADRVARGERLGRDDARAVLESYDLIAIGMMGDEARRRLRGTRTTFVRVFEVHTEAPPPAIPDSTTAGEFRIVGRPASLDAAANTIARTRALAGAAPVTGYSLRELVALSQGRDHHAVFARLKNAGLDAVAEVSIDDAAEVFDAVRVARGAGLTVARLTVQGVDSTASADRNNWLDRQVVIIERGRALQESFGGFRAFAPLPRTASITTPTTGYDDVKALALARLILTDIESIQVDWALYGPKLAQVGLTVGADDVDGVEATDPGTLGTRRGPLEEIRRNIRAAALEPVERDGLFRVIERVEGGGVNGSAA